MSDPVEEFFSGLGRRGYEPLLRHDRGSIRFDLQDGAATEHWRVTIDAGQVSVGPDDAVADTTVTLQRSALAAVVTGRQNLLNILMLGQAGVAGDVEKLVSFQRLFGALTESPQPQTTRR